jgi:hypothetical protein
MKQIDLCKSLAKEAEILTCAENAMDVLLKQCGGGVTLEGVAKTSMRYLVGYIEILEDHSLPLTLRFFAQSSDTEKVYIRFVLLPRVKTLVCFDLNCVDCSMGSLQRTPGALKQVVYGTRTDWEDIVRVELGVKPVYHDVRLHFENFYLSNEKPGEFPLPDVKLVDEFGQWKPKEWLGKVHNLDELAALMHANEGPTEYPFPHWNRWGGDSTRKLQEGTGFFSTCKTGDGRWHLTDPDGCDYFSVGPCCVRNDETGDITGFEKQLDWLPDLEDPNAEALFKIGKHPWFSNEIKLFGFVRANLIRVYGEQWEDKWKEMSYHILKGNGINSQGNGPGLDVNNGKSRLPYVRQLPDFPTTRTAIFRDFPDVLSPEYRENSIRCAKHLEEWKDDHWMIGYFLRNEPGFNFIPGIAVANEVLHNPAFTYCRLGLLSFLRGRYGLIENLNTVWKTGFASFEELEKPIDDCVGMYPESEPDLRAYSVYLVREYCRIPSQACKAVDPNHLNLGLRWSKMNNPDMLAGWENFDVFSFNCYAFDPVPDMEFVRNAGVNLPILVGEFHCGALDRGLPSTGLKGVINQQERGVMWRMFVEKCAAHPYGVGAHWFQYNDEFCLGRFDGENYQIGMVDVCMRPYKELVEAAKETSSVLYKVKNGEADPFTSMPGIIPMIG